MVMANEDQSSAATAGHRWSATDAAGYVFERLAAGVDGAGIDREIPRDDVGGSTFQGMKARTSLARAVDTYSDLLRSAFTSFASDVTQAVARDPEPVAQPTPVTLVGSPGSAAGATAWIHNTSGSFVPAFNLRITDLFRADGSRLSADLGSTEPDWFEASMDQRRSAWVSVEVPAEAGLGVYYGHLLAKGLPDAAVPLRLVVRRPR